MLGLNYEHSKLEFDIDSAFPGLSGNVRLDEMRANHNPFANNPRLAQIPIIRNGFNVVSTIPKPLPNICEEIVKSTRIMSYYDDLRNKVNTYNINEPIPSNRYSIKEFILYIHIDAKAVYGIIVIKECTLHFLLFHKYPHRDPGVIEVADCKNSYMEHWTDRFNKPYNQNHGPLPDHSSSLEDRCNVILTQKVEQKNNTFASIYLHWRPMFRCIWPGITNYGGMQKTPLDWLDVSWLNIDN